MALEVVHLLILQLRFLPVVLQMTGLATKLTVGAVRQALDTPPKTLNDILDETMQRIEDQDEDARLLAEKVLYWVSYTIRPLSLDEIQHALAVELGTSELNRRGIHRKEDLSSVCQGFITADYNCNQIRFTHRSIQEYFLRVRKTRFPQGRTSIASTCLTYLLFDVFAEGACPCPITWYFRRREYPFLSYAARNWGTHACGEPEPDVQDLVVRLVGQKLNLEALIQAMDAPSDLVLKPGVLESSPYHALPWVEYKHWTYDPLAASEFEPQCKKSYEAFGILNDLVTIRKHDYFESVTGLQIVSRFGLETLVRLLLDRGSDVNAKDAESRTALHLAAQNGHQGCVQALLDKGADIDAVDIEYDFTALHLAAQNGHCQCVLVLLKEGADVNKGAPYGMTALHVAAQYGHDDCVQALLDEGADMDAETGENWVTALEMAAQLGNTAVVKTLLEHRVVGPVILEIGCDWRAILLALEGGHEESVQLLISGDKSRLQQRDQDGRTLLSMASESGFKNALQVLLALDDAEVDSRDGMGRTPLWWAACTGKEYTVKMLLDCGADVNIGDVHKNTALHAAAANDRVGVLRLLLLSAYRANIKEVLDIERDALEIALFYYREETASFLLDNWRRDSWGIKGSHLENGRSVNWSVGGMTPLHLLAWNRWNHAVTRYSKNLIKSPYIETVNKSIPLKLYSGSAMSMDQHRGMIQMLLKKGFELGARDDRGRTLLHYAVACELVQLVRVLLDGTVFVKVGGKEELIDTKDNRGSTALHVAAIFGSNEMVKILLDGGASRSISEHDSRGKTPREVAADKGQQEMVRILEEVEYSSKQGNRGFTFRCSYPL